MFTWLPTKPVELFYVGKESNTEEALRLVGRNIV